MRCSAPGMWAYYHHHHHSQYSLCSQFLRTKGETVYLRPLNAPAFAPCSALRTVPSVSNSAAGFPEHQNLNCNRAHGCRDRRQTRIITTTTQHMHVHGRRVPSSWSLDVQLPQAIPARLQSQVHPRERSLPMSPGASPRFPDPSPVVASTGLVLAVALARPSAGWPHPWPGTWVHARLQPLELNSSRLVFPSIAQPGAVEREQDGTVVCCIPEYYLHGPLPDLFWTRACLSPP